MGTDYMGFAFAAIVTVGGVMGYVKSGSVPSLAAGISFGVALGIGSLQTSTNPNNYMVTLGTSVILGGIMGARFYNSKKIMPAGLLTILSVMMVCRCAAQGLGLIGTKTKVLK